MAIFTTAQVAARLGINASRVRQLAIEHHIGTKLNNRMRVFTEEDVQMIDSARNPIGRPPFAKLVTGAADPEPPETLADLAAKLVATGIATDPAEGPQTVAVSRGIYDRFVAALGAAPASDPLTVAARTLVAFADVDEATVDFSVPAFRRFDAAR